MWFLSPKTLNYLNNERKRRIIITIDNKEKIVTSLQMVEQATQNRNLRTPYRSGASHNGTQSIRKYSIWAVYSNSNIWETEILTNTLRQSPTLNKHPTSTCNTIAISQNTSKFQTSNHVFRRKSRPMIPTYRVTSQSIRNTSTKSTKRDFITSISQGTQKRCLSTLRRTRLQRVPVIS